jgi:hypothetical protein
MVEDDHVSSFYCPTQVNKNWDISHYSRQVTQVIGNKYRHFQYTAQVLPFVIDWYTGTGNLFVYQYNSTNEIHHKILQKANQDFETFIKTCRRFKILVPFS